MQTVWDANSYDSERRRLVPCFDEFYGTLSELVARSCSRIPSILDLGAGTGIASAIIVNRIGSARLHLLDSSSEMLKAASVRLASFRPELFIQPLTAPLPRGPFDAIVSALAIHHLSNENKRLLYGRILEVLAPGGVFINAEQVSGRSPRLQQLFEAVHLDTARGLGSSEAEIQGAVRRMSYDQCATTTDQVYWLEAAGFQDVDCFYRSFRFAVFGGWKPRF
jgi:tRNA (cmo5U34)-methyltransferase